MSASPDLDPVTDDQDACTDPDCTCLDSFALARRVSRRGDDADLRLPVLPPPPPHTPPKTAQDPQSETEGGV